jgi:FkbM family methyltransferase
VSNILRNVAKPLIHAVRQSGVQVNPISGRDLSLSGIKLQWRGDDPHVMRGAVTDTIVDGQNIHFFVVNESDLIQREHLAGRFYENEELAIIARHFSGGVFVDVGCNVGNHAIYALKILNADKVIAFEPNPEALRILKANIALNDLTTRATIHPVGLDSKPGRANFATPHNNLGATHVVRDRVQDAAIGGFELVRGDDVLGGETVDFIKIDTEGLELAVLDGLSDTLSRCRPILFVEVDDRNEDAFVAFCRRTGYGIVETFKRYPINTNYLLKA